MKKKEVQNYEKEVREKEYLFEQWIHQMRKDDIESESNPSEDELTAVERIEKVMEQAKPKKKSKPKSKKKIKKTLQEDIAPITRLNASIEEKHNLLFQEDGKHQ